MYAVPFNDNDNKGRLSFDQLPSYEVNLGLTPVASIKESTRIAFNISTQHICLKSENDKDDLLLLTIIVGDDPRSTALTFEMIDFSSQEIASLQSKISSFIANQTTYDGVMEGGVTLLKNLCKLYKHKTIKIRRIAFRLRNVRHLMDNENVHIPAGDDDRHDDDSFTPDGYSSFWDNYEQGLMRDYNTLSYKIKVARKLGAVLPGETI